MFTTVVVGNPKPASHTLEAATMTMTALTGRSADRVVDLSSLGVALVSGGSAEVADAVRAVQRSSVAVFASPTYLATYTGLLKTFLDQFAGGPGLRGVLGVAVMVGGGPSHALAPDVLLKPVLCELGATCALPGLYLQQQTYATGADIQKYAERWRSVVGALTGAAVGDETTSDQGSQ